MQVVCEISVCRMLLECSWGLDSHFHYNNSTLHMNPPICILGMRLSKLCLHNQVALPVAQQDLPMEEILAMVLAADPAMEYQPQNVIYIVNYSLTFKPANPVIIIPREWPGYAWEYYYTDTLTNTLIHDPTAGANLEQRRLLTV